MTMVERFNEHAAAALNSVKPHLARIGAELKGILGNDGHVYGYHLSKVRLIGTGKTGDKSLVGPANNPCADDRAACAIDYSMDWQASGEHLEDVRRRCASGELVEVTELIGDPDLIPGAPRDIKDACYAAPSTNWRWVEYHGQGHVTWAHIGIGRRHANDARLGDKLFGGWTATGRQEDGMANVTDTEKRTLLAAANRMSEIYLQWYHSDRPGSRADMLAQLEVLTAAVARLTGMQAEEVSAQAAERARELADDQAAAARDANLATAIERVQVGDPQALAKVLGDHLTAELLAALEEIRLVRASAKG